MMGASAGMMGLSYYSGFGRWVGASGRALRFRLTYRHGLRPGRSRLDIPHTVIPAKAGIYCAQADWTSRLESPPPKRHANT